MFNNKKSLNSTNIHFFIAAIIYIFSYIVTFYFAHHSIDINKYLEGVMLSIIPIIISTSYLCVTNISKIDLKKFFQFVILPLCVVEKLFLPIYRYFHIYHNSLEKTIGILDKKDYFFYLIRGEVGPIQFYNNFYLAFSVLAILLLYITFKKLLPIIVKRKTMVTFWLVSFIIFMITVSFIELGFSPEPGYLDSYSITFYFIICVIIVTLFLQTKYKNIH